MERTLRLARLRSTAVPNLRWTDIPSREWFDSPSETSNTKNGCVYAFPVARTRLKSVVFLRRNLRFTYCLPVCIPGDLLPLSGSIVKYSNKPDPRVALTLPACVLHVVVFRHGQFRAASRAPPPQYLTSVCRRHSGAKSVYTHPATNFWLISPFRHVTSFRFLN